MTNPLQTLRSPLSDSNRRPLPYHPTLGVVRSRKEWREPLQTGGFRGGRGTPYDWVRNLSWPSAGHRRSREQPPDRLRACLDGLE
jgi:hypothetical protein